MRDVVELLSELLLYKCNLVMLEFISATVYTVYFPVRKISLGNVLQ